MITWREVMRGLLVVAILLLAAMVGRWLSANEPEMLATWRFVNGLAILFLLVIVLFKWERVESDLLTHRAELRAVLMEIQSFVERTVERAEAERSAHVTELIERMTVVTSLVERTTAESKQRHEAIGAQLDQVLEQKKEREASE